MQSQFSHVSKTKYFRFALYLVHTKCLFPFQPCLTQCSAPAGTLGRISSWTGTPWRWGRPSAVLRTPASPQRGDRSATSAAVWRTRGPARCSTCCRRKTSRRLRSTCSASWRPGVSGLGWVGRPNHPYLHAATGGFKYGGGETSRQPRARKAE